MSPDDGGTGEAEERGLKKKEHLAVPLPALSPDALHHKLPRKSTRGTT